MTLVSKKSKSRRKKFKMMIQNKAKRIDPLFVALVEMFSAFDVISPFFLSFCLIIICVILLFQYFIVHYHELFLI